MRPLAAVLLLASAGCASSAAHRDFAVEPGLAIAYREPDEATHWKILGDRLMFGKSTGAEDAVDGVGVFHGTVVARRGGGWCSARRDLEAPSDISRADAIVLRVRGDGKTYGFDLRDRDSLGGTYWEAPFAAEPGVWKDVVLRMEDFAPLAMGAPTHADRVLDLHSIKSVALVIGGNQNGPYRLEVESIRSVTGSEHASAK